MKTHFSRSTLLVLTTALSLAVTNITQAQDQPTPDPATAPASDDNSLPPGVDPASPTAQVIKLAQSGSDVSVINAYVANSASAFDLDADQIVALKDVGVPTAVINNMMAHDKGLGSSTPSAPAAPAPEPAAVVTSTAPTPAPDATMGNPPDNSGGVTTDDGTDTEPPAAPLTVDDFNGALNPYGTWVDVNGYGRCWRPTTVVYDNAWCPYGDRGHWVNTDYGWYWNSDYAWGVTFHYGRWFRDNNFGWCWFPDTQWAPSWVVWRSSDDYCGWAPLPPFAVFRPGFGFFYRGARVGADFDFGLGVNSFVFVSPGHFYDRRPRSFFVDRTHVGDVFDRTTIQNHFDAHGRTFVNTGIPVARISAAAHRNIDTVRVSALPTARREGWRGAVVVHPTGTQFHGNDAGHENFNTGHDVNLNTGHNVNNNVNLHPENHYPVNHTENEFNHSTTYVAPKAPAPEVHENFNSQQNTHVNEHHYEAVQTIHTAPTPRTSAPETYYAPAAEEHVQTTTGNNHTYTGESESHSSGGNRGGSGSGSSSGGGQKESQSQGQGQGQSQGQSSGSGQNRQNH